jgi:hypothetical protein
MLNLAAGLEGFIGNPSWRPSFRTPWWLALAGAASCLAVMMMINAGATIVATVVCGGVYALTKKRNLGARWTDIRRVLLVMLTRAAVYALAGMRKDAKSWRPNVLVLGGSPKSRWHLVSLADAITHGKGFLTVATVLDKNEVKDERLASIEDGLRDYLARQKIPALVEVTRAFDVMKGAESLIRHYGLGPVVPNTIVLGVSEDPQHVPMLLELLLLCMALKRNVIMVRESDLNAGEDKDIHLWLGDDKASNSFMLALAYMLQTSPEWRGAELGLWALASSEEKRAAKSRSLGAFILKSRLDAGLQVDLAEEGVSIFDRAHQRSKGASLLLFSAPRPAADATAEDLKQQYAILLDALQGMPASALIWAFEDVDFEQIFI